MKKLLSIALIATLAFSTTRVVCYTIVNGRGIVRFQNCCTSGTDYDTIADALNDAQSGDEVVICPRGRGWRPAYYNESDLNISVSNLYVHSYGDDPSKVVIYDNSGNPIFNVKSNGATIKGLTIDQNSNQMDINVTSTDIDLEDLILNSQGEGVYIYGDLQNSLFDDVNITSSGRCIDANGAIFKGVVIKNSEFNQTASGKYAFTTQANPFEDSNFSNVYIYSSEGYGLYFASGIKDSNFSNFYGSSYDDNLVVNSGDVDNIRFIDSNLSSETGRSLSINSGSLLNSYFDDFNFSAKYEALYVNSDIVNTTFKNFKISGSYGVYGNNYIKTSVFENGEINASDTGMYSSKEFNQSTIYGVKIKADNYGLFFSENSNTGAKNDENNLSNLLVIQTSNGSSNYSGIRFRKKITNSYIGDVNITSTEKGFWLNTGGSGNTFENCEFNSSQNNALSNSYLMENNTFSNIKVYSDESSAIGFNGDVKYNTFDTFYIESNQSNGIYGNSGINIIGNDFRNLKIKADNYGVYFKDDISDNNFTNIYSRVNKYSFKFGQYSTNDYFLNLDLNGTKGIEFNISGGDIVQNAKIITDKYEPLYFYNIKNSAVELYDLNLTSTKDNCIYVDTLDADLNISTKTFLKNELNCSDYNGIQISNDSTSSLNVKNTNFTINIDSTDTSKALIKVKSLGTLYIYNSILNGANKVRGIYVTSNLDNLYIYKSTIADANDSGIYLAKVNNYFDIEDNNISKNDTYGFYLYSVGSGFNKGEIKRNYFIENGDYAIKIFTSENDTPNFEVWTNCFYYNQDNSDYSQAYTYDTNAKYDDGNSGNFWSDWNESDKYQIDPSSIGLYDNHPLYYCPLDVLFDARDADRNFSDRNISIKIAGKDFNLTIFNINGGPFKGTVCSKIVDNEDNATSYTGWMKLSFDDNNELNLTNIEVNHSVRSARVHIIWNTTDSTCDEVLNDDHNSSFSTDTFAIRPLKYRVKFSQMPLFAGEEFDLNVSAISYLDKTLSEYNRTDINITADMNRSSLICDYPHAEFNLTSLNFTNGDSNNTAKFDEVGEMNLTIVDNDFDLAAGGSDECNDSNECISVYGYDGKDSRGVYCCNIEANPKWDVNLSQVDIKVYDLNITRDLINTTNGKDWIYMDSNLSEFNASPTIEITAFNKSGKQLSNFDKLCLAKDMNISFRYDLHNDNGDINLTYKGTVNDNEKSIYDFNKTIEVNKSMFAKGDTNASYSYNIERNNSIPLYVVYGNLKEINFTTNGIAKNENNLSTDLNISMYYGNIKTFDVTTNKNDIDVKVYFIVYDNDSEYKPSNENKAFNWYLNTKHTDKEGNISSTIHISDDYTAKDKYNDKFTISVDNVSDGEQVIHISRLDDSVKFAVFHLTMDKNVSHWLWFSYGGKEYNDSLNSTCAHHFCFAITWKEANNEDNSRTVKSGENLLGTEAPLSEYNRTAKGVKIYR